MLKEYLLEWCQEQIDEASEGHCGQHCDNQEYCKHDCDNCLDQVHWYPSHPGRADYTCFNLLLRYVLRFTSKYSHQITSALDLVDLSYYPQYNIFSIGCGGVPDLMAFEELDDGTTIHYKGYDRNKYWQKIHDKVEEYAEGNSDFKVHLHQRDIFDVFSEGKPQNSHYNILVIQYMLSHLYNTGQNGKMHLLFDYIIENLVSRRVTNSPFLIIITDVDSMNKGRNYWFTFLDKLEEAGYHGIAIARSAFPVGDLGAERWSHHKQSDCFGNISYQYFQNSSEHDGAQLIIELR